MLRLAGFTSEGRIAWIGESPDRSAQALEQLSGRTVELRADVESLGAVGWGMIVSPGLALERGLEAAIKTLRPLLETDGLLVVVGRVFVGSEVPGPLAAHWNTTLPEPVRTVKDSLAQFAAQSCEPLTCELLGEPTLSEHDRQLVAAATRATSGEALAEAASGVRHGTSLGLLVGRRIEPGAPPRWPRRGGGE